MAISSANRFTDIRPASRAGTAIMRFRTWPYLAHAILWVSLLSIYAYTPPRWQDWNQNSRFDLTMALVEQQTVRIDAYAANTGDYATIDGHIYSDKAPGLSFGAVPVYALTRVMRPIGLSRISEQLGRSEGFAATLNPAGAGTSVSRIDLAVALFIATTICVGIPAATAMVLVALIVERLWGCRTAGLITALVFGLATPLFPYAQAFYGHVPAAACLVGAFALIVLRPGETISNRRLIALGFFLSWSFITEYPAALIGLPIALWAMVLARGRAVIWGLAGALPPLVLLATYNLAAFGTPLPVGYEHSTLWQEQHQHGFLSLTYPKLDAIWGLSGSPFRGLFFFAPVLLLTIPGIWLASRAHERRAATIVAMAGFVGIFFFVASSAMWWGGWAVGPRYLLPGLPMLAVPFGAFVAWSNSQRPLARLSMLGLTTALAGLSILLIWATTFGGQSYPSDELRLPLTEQTLPALIEGNVARNIGMAIGLRGIVSLVPISLFLALGVVGIGLTLGRPNQVRRTQS